MKLLCALLFTVAPCSAQWAVIDAANLSQSITNHAAMLEQLAKQAAQITNQIQQINQMADQLRRLGKMSDVKAELGFPQFRLDLTLPSQLQGWAHTMASVNGTALFGDPRGGAFDPISPRYSDWNGELVARVPSPYKPAQAVTASVDGFKRVQSDVYVRRAQVKQAIAHTSDALQGAATEAEAKKYSAVLQAEYGELSTLDSEVALSATEVQARNAEAAAMATGRFEAEAETRRTLAQQETQKLTAAFKPAYKSVLEYLNEKPFGP